MNSSKETDNTKMQPDVTSPLLAGASTTQPQSIETCLLKTSDKITQDRQAQVENKISHDKCINIRNNFQKKMKEKRDILFEYVDTEKKLLAQLNTKIKKKGAAENKTPMENRSDLMTNLACISAKLDKLIKPHNFPVSSCTQRFKFNARDIKGMKLSESGMIARELTDLREKIRNLKICYKKYFAKIEALEASDINDMELIFSAQLEQYHKKIGTKTQEASLGIEKALIEKFVNWFAPISAGYQIEYQRLTTEYRSQRKVYLEQYQYLKKQVELIKGNHSIDSDLFKKSL